MVTLGLGFWEGHQEWPLTWLQAAQHAKVYGVIVASQFAITPGRLLGPHHWRHQEGSA